MSRTVGGQRTIRDDKERTVKTVTMWRDQAVVPNGHEDLAALMRLARIARRCRVTFEWEFDRDNIRRLQRAVHEWGARVTGRYRRFDRMVLSAINEALNEQGSPYVLGESVTATTLECQVSCTVTGDSYRLAGYAPADLILGYGLAAIDDRKETSARLGDATSRYLETAVGQLGWDLRSLIGEPQRAVRNSLFGLRPTYGIDERALRASVEAAAHRAVEVRVNFQGPYSARDDAGCVCLFGQPAARQRGIYLWTIEVEGEARTLYIGQTDRSFGRRIGEHLRAYLSGEYAIPDVPSLVLGQHKRRWNPTIGARRWPDSLPEFLKDYDGHAASISALLKVLRFHVAPLSGGKAELSRVEGALGRYFRGHPEARLLEFLEPGIQLPARVPYDPPLRMVFSSETPIAGLPREILE